MGDIIKLPSKGIHHVSILSGTMIELLNTQCGSIHILPRGSKWGGGCQFEGKGLEPFSSFQRVLTSPSGLLGVEPH